LPRLIQKPLTYLGHNCLLKLMGDRAELAYRWARTAISIGSSDL